MVTPTPIIVIKNRNGDVLEKIEAVTLVGVVLSNIYLGKADFTGLNLCKANLSGSNLKKADFTQANLSGANLNRADLVGANFTNANLEGADLNGADLFGADLTGANLRGVKLAGADLSTVKLDKLDLRGADMRGADLSWAELHNTNLSGADLSGADLRGGHFDCGNVVLVGADLTNANLSGADLRGADLTGADLSGVIFSDTTQLFGAVLKDVVNLPDYQIPQGVELTGYKMLRGGRIAKLLIPADVPRTGNLLSKKRRSLEALVVAILDKEGNPTNIQGGASLYKREFKYVVGQTVKAAHDWNDNPCLACTGGIHWFDTFQEVAAYAYGNDWMIS